MRHTGLDLSNARPGRQSHPLSHIGAGAPERADDVPQRSLVRWSVVVSRLVGGVLCPGPLRESGSVAIHLCGPPGSVCGRAALSLLDLAPDGVCRAAPVARGAGALLPHRFTLTCARPRHRSASRAIGGLFSVALSCGSPRLAASQHPALWSPDLPQPGAASATRAAATRPTHHRQSVWRVADG